MNHIFAELNGPDDWKRLLADPEKHWRTGYSARALAYCWLEATGFPPEIAALLQSCEYPPLRICEPTRGIPEYKVELPGRGHDSQNDLFVSAKTADNSLVILMVEGKVGEPFDKRLADWKADGDGLTDNKRQRLDGLCKLLGLSPDSLPDTIYYQLVHRTASAVIEAERFGAAYAVMAVHSFSQSDEHFEDFQQFVGLYRQSAKVGQLLELTQVGQVRLFAGWARGDAQYLTR